MPLAIDHNVHLSSKFQKTGKVMGKARQGHGWQSREKMLEGTFGFPAQLLLMTTKLLCEVLLSKISQQ